MGLHGAAVKKALRAAVKEVLLQGPGIHGAAVKEVVLQGPGMHGAAVRKVLLQGLGLHRAAVKQVLLQGLRTARGCRKRGFTSTARNSATLRVSLPYRFHTITEPEFPLGQPAQWL